MTDKAREMIEKYRVYESSESDKSAREIAAARQYWTGDPDSMRVAEAIWKLLGTSQAMIESYIRSKPTEDHES